MTTICVGSRSKLKNIQTGLIISQDIQYSPLQVSKYLLALLLLLTATIADDVSTRSWMSFITELTFWGFFLNMVKKKINCPLLHVISLTWEAFFLGIHHSGIKHPTRVVIYADSWVLPMFSESTRLAFQFQTADRYVEE